MWSPTCRVGRRKVKFEDLQCFSAGFKSISSKHRTICTVALKTNWKQSTGSCWIAVSILNRIFSSLSQNRWDMSRSSAFSITRHFLLPCKKDVLPTTWSESIDVVYLPIWWILSNRDAEFFVSIDRLDRKSIETLCFLWTSTFIMNREQSSELNGKNFGSASPALRCEYS